MSRERMGLSYFEAILHKRHKGITLSSEIKDCFNYFEHEIPEIGQSKKIGTSKIESIHGNGIEIRKVAEGKGYSIQTGRVVKIVGVDRIPKPEQIEIVRKIRNVSFPYAEYKRSK